MTTTTVLHTGAISVYDYRCSAGPHSKPFVERHSAHSMPYVRKGSFGCTRGGKSFELVAGSLMIGHPGGEYVCSHDHHVCGDECLSFSFMPGLVDEIGGSARAWQTGCAPPLPQLMVLGELAQAVVDGRSDLGLDEVGHALASRFVEVIAGRTQKPLRANARDRARVVATALWIDAHSHQTIDLEAAA